MGFVFTAITASGPIVGVLGLYFGSPIMFWIGVVISLFNLFMNLASGAMSRPILPVLFVAAGGVLTAAIALVGNAIGPPWYYGWGLGLLTWTALEAAGELLPPKWWQP